MDESRQRGGTVTGREGRGERVGGERDCKGENYEVTSGGACTSFRFRSHSTPSLLLQRSPARPSPASPSSALSSRVWSWRLDSLVAFLTPFFTGKPLPSLSFRLFLSFSFLLVRESRAGPLSGAGPRCSETSHNGVTWLLLSRAHTPRSYSIAYTSPLPESHPTEVNPLYLLSHPCSCCIMHTPHQINGGCGGPFGEPDSCTSIIQVGAEGGDVQDTPGAQEVSRLGAQVTRYNWRKLSSLKRVFPPPPLPR